MKLKKVTALVRTEMLEIVKAKLKDIGVPHVTIDYVSGYENPRQLFEMSELITHARIEVLMEEPRVKETVDCIANNAFTGTYDDGVITVSPIDDVYKINTGGKHIVSNYEKQGNDKKL
jgi:nitrogen regulatory protein P-II 1